jgi:c-di-GMP-binding flagellar brake protein YcgR
MTRITERRKYPRISTENRVAYILFNAAREKIDRGIGYALNLSQTGVLLKTEKILEGSFIVLVSLDLEGQIIKVKGKVTRYFRDSDCFFTGVEFIGSKDEQLEAIKAFVKNYLHKKHNNRG